MCFDLFPHLLTDLVYTYESINTSKPSQNSNTALTTFRFHSRRFSSKLHLQCRPTHTTCTSTRIRNSVLRQTVYSWWFPRNEGRFAVVAVLVTVFVFVDTKRNKKQRWLLAFKKTNQNTRGLFLIKQWTLFIISTRQNNVRIFGISDLQLSFFPPHFL